jgi:hypothetical protein
VVTFDDYIRETQGMTVEEWTQESGFRLQTGIHAMLYQDAQVAEVDLRDHFDRHRRDYIQPPMADLSVMYFPFRGQGDQPASEEERQITREWVGNLHAQIADGRLAFAKLHRRFRPDEADAGRIGWVHPDGTNPELGAPDVPPQVAEAALRTRPRPEHPELLPLMESPDGLTIALVHALKPAHRPAFEDIRERVRRDYIDANLDSYSRSFRNDLRRQADISYSQSPSFDAIKRQRIEAAAAFVQRRQAELNPGATADTASAQQPGSE